MTPWPEITLGEIAEFKYGKSLPASKRDGGKFAVYGSNGPVGHHSAAITRGAAVVIGRKGSFGEIRYSHEPCWPIDTTYFIDESSTSADLRWLAFRLENLGLTDLNGSSAVPGLRKEDAYRKKILLPPVHEQRRVATILARANAIREQQNNTLSLIEDSINSVFQRLFGQPDDWPGRWPIVHLGEMIKSTQYGTSEKSGATGKWPVLRMGNLTDDGRLDLSDLKYMNLKPSDLARYTVERGDLLFNRTNSLEKVGKASVVNTEESLAYAGYLIRVRLNDDCDAEFVSAYLRSPHGKNQRKSMAKPAVNQANISASQMQKFLIPKPPYNLQKRFSNYRSLARGLAESKKLSLSSDLFSSLKHSLFEGEL